jgi:hypothetical protein
MTDDRMERREILKLAAAASLVGAAEPGCASPSRTAPASPVSPTTVANVAAQLDPAAADALLAKIDARMNWLRTASLPDEVLPLARMPRGAFADAELASTGELVRKSIRTLYLTGRFLDLPDTMKVHPGMQARLRAIQPEMDDAVLGMTARLERMTPEDHRRVQGHLRKDEQFGERLARLLEKTAADDGLSFQRTFGVRSATLEMSQRMAAQSPSLVVDPLVRKVRRIEAHPRTDAEESRRLAARIGEDAFWAHQERITLLHEAWATRLGSASALASNDYVWPSSAPPAGAAHAVYQNDPSEPLPPPAPGPAKPSSGKRVMGTGGIVMGFGLGSVALGLICAGISAATSTSALVIPALILGVTIGPILLVAGLIVVIVGAIMRAYE